MNLAIETDDVLSLYHTNGQYLGVFEVLSGRGNRWAVTRGGKKGFLTLDPSAKKATLDFNGKSHTLKPDLFFSIEKTPE